MDNKTLQELLPGTRRSFKAGSPVLYQGEVPRSGFYIVKGVVKSYTLQASGEEQIVSFLREGDFLPISWLFGKTSTSMYFYETVELTQVISVLPKDVIELTKNNIEFGRHIIGKLINESAAFQMRITALEQPRAVEKILYTLYYLLFQFGKPTLKKGEYRIDIKLTQSTIAAMIGLTRETTATELNRLKRKRVLRYNSKIYYVDKALLEKTMGEHNFSDLLGSNR